MTYQISAGPAATTPPVDIGRIEPHIQHKFSGEVTVPADATDATPLAVTIAVGNPVVAEQKISIAIMQPHRLCNQGQLSLADYQRKHKRLDEEFQAGRVTQAKFNDDLAELWSCVRHSQARLQAAPGLTPAATP